jgi:hypothetical protein
VSALSAAFAPVFAEVLTGKPRGKFGEKRQEERRQEEEGRQEERREGEATEGPTSSSQ